METMKLKGGQIFTTLEKNTVYKVLNGIMLIYMASYEKHLIGKRHLIIEVSQDNEEYQVPSLFVDDIEHGKWCFVIAALGETVIECKKIESQTEYDDIVLSFAKGIELKIESAEDFETEMVEMIQRKYVAEELVIYRKRQEYEKEFQRGIDSIIGLFKKQDILIKELTPNNLYNSVALLCKKKNIYIAPYEMVVEACGKRFGIEELARISHFMVREIRLEKDWFKRDSGSVLIYKEDTEEYCVPVACVPVGTKKYKEYDCQEGTSKIITEDISKKYLRTAYMIYKPFPSRELSKSDLIRFCIEAIYKQDILGILFLSFVTMLIGLWLPYLTQVIYDRYLLWGNRIALLQIGGVAITFTIGNLLFLIVKKMVVFRTSNQMEIAIQSAMFDRLFNLEEKIYGMYESSDLVRRALSISNIVTSVVDDILVSMITNLFSFIYFLRMLSYSRLMTGIALIMVLIQMFINIIFAEAKGKYEKRIIEFKTKASSIMYQAILGIAKIKIAGAGSTILLKYFEPYIEAKKYIAKREKLNYGVNHIYVFSTILNTIIFYCLLVKINLDLSIGQFLGFSSAFTLFSLSMQQISLTYSKAKQLQPLYYKLKILLDTPPESEEGCYTVSKLQGNIEVSNVSFRYHPEEGMVISNLSMKVDKGEYIGIVGSSGSGKSTLLKLLLGFESPTYGKIYYDDKDLDSLDKRELRKFLGVVLQDGQLIAGTIYENIVIASTAVTKEEHKREIEKVLQIIKTVGLDNDIKLMPMGIETVISEGAATISGGQRQRILIARAIFHNPSILYFDEATSALDNINQALIAENLKKVDTTRVVIAHRLSTVKNCDRILVMEKGRIIEEGTYDELMLKKGYFYNMAQRQAV